MMRGALREIRELLAACFNVVAVLTQPAYCHFLALRFLLKRPINLLGMLGVAVGVWALILVVSIFSGFIREVRSHIRSATADISVLRLPWPCEYGALRRTILADPNVAACAPRLVWYGLLHSYGATHEVIPRIRTVDQPGADSRFVSVLGIDPAAELEVTGLRDWLAAADPPLRVSDLDAPLAPVAGRPAILMSQRRLERGELVGKGHAVKLITARMQSRAREDGGFGLEQALETAERVFTIAGAFRTKHTAFDNFYVLVHIDVLRDMLAHGLGEVVTEISVRCKDPARSAETAARLQRRLNETRNPRDTILALTWEQRNEPFLSAVEHQRSLMKLVLLVIMVVAGFLMYATLSMMVTEKTHDIGILTALGGTRRGVVGIFTTCGLALTCAGAALGVVGGCLSSVHLDDINRGLRAAFGIDLFPASIYNLSRVPYDLDPVWITQVVASALLVGLIVSGTPAWWASRKDPIDALRNE